MNLTDEQKVKLTTAINGATGGVVSVEAKGSPTIHIQLGNAIVNNHKAVLCGMESDEWIGSKHKGLSFVNHPDRCRSCHKLLYELMDKVFLSVGIDGKRRT